MAEKKELSMDERIKKEFNRLKRIFKHIPKERKDTAISLMRNAAFMTATLDDLQDQINRKGYITEYQNGENQWGTKKSPEVDIYNVMIKNHMAVIKQLCDLLPDDSKKEATDELMEFVKGVAK
ncbi:hypothetical protein [Melghirimyces algeriensis]|uniref:Phage terminase, small subunit, putative, P27 family n=1 Tax=Melghirimyces algeriensis TaxID=910412 RepID=A0A521C5C5_9BACL|nr:hypothetical protein [Melghirimyces algeriensis]SMO54717.1 hypothetical protein SAMN06264849_103145 [Melghirimyces algeriensis]